MVEFAGEPCSYSTALRRPPKRGDQGLQGFRPVPLAEHYAKDHERTLLRRLFDAPGIIDSFSVSFRGATSTYGGFTEWYDPRQMCTDLGIHSH